MKTKFRAAPQTGRPVEPPPGASFAHEFTRPDGTKFIVARGPGGRLLAGNRLCDVREGDLGGQEARNPKSVARLALGLPTKWGELRARKRKEAEGKR